MKNVIYKTLLMICPLILSSCAQYGYSSSSESLDALEKTKIEYDYQDYCDYNSYAKSKCPSQGDGKFLVIPVWFTDSSDYIKNKDNVLSDIKTAYFGSEEETGWESVSSYYKEASLGKLNMIGTISDWYECGFNLEDERLTTFDGLRVFVSEVVDAYFKANPNESKSDYDQNDDGFMDAVSLIYGGPNYQDGGLSNTILWAYCDWLTLDRGTVEEPNPCAYFWASYDFMYDQETAEKRAGTTYYAGYYNGDVTLDTHTYIHETGHLLGLDDYYDLSRQYNPAGGFSMQDYTIGSTDPFSLMALGWADPYIPTESMSITIKDFQSSHDVILLTPSWNEYNSVFDEYLLLELFTPTGLNKADCTEVYSKYEIGPSSSGIRLWHVDARLVEYTLNDQNKETLIVDEPVNVASGKGYVNNAFSNTSVPADGSDSEYLGYYGKLGHPETYDYNLLQLIRNDKEASYKCTDWLDNGDLFKEGDSFDMKTYAGQFCLKEQGQGEDTSTALLNIGESLGWSFTVSDMVLDEDGIATQCTIELTKEQSN